MALPLTRVGPPWRRFQVEYALEAVRKGALAVGVRGADTIVLGAWTHSSGQLSGAGSGDPSAFGAIWA